MRREMFINALNSIADAGREIMNKRLSLNLSLSGDDGLLELCQDLLTEKGEALGTALARDVLKRYSALDENGRLNFFCMLRDDFEPPQEELYEAINTYLIDPTPENRQSLEQKVEAPRQALFRAFNMAPGGTQSLVDMREDLLPFLREDASLKVVDADFVHMFLSWFNRGFLRMWEINWETPAAVLEKIIHYEAVHAIADWTDLRRRLEQDRRCFGFFHPALPDEPLIFVEVALTRELSATVQGLINDGDPGPAHEASHAIFYSISNCQRGLRGISFGNFLIKQVVMDLMQELPNITTFSTLSPVPGFRKWVETELIRAMDTPDFPQPEEESFFTSQRIYAIRELAARNVRTADELTGGDRELLMPLGAYYLTRLKKRSAPYDPVARFHLGNGARLERLNWLGDSSENGIEQAFGLMVNYLYDLPSIEQNHEAFICDGDIALGKPMKGILALPPAKPVALTG